MGKSPRYSFEEYIEWVRRRDEGMFDGGLETSGGGGERMYIGGGVLVILLIIILILLLT